MLGAVLHEAVARHVEHGADRGSSMVGGGGRSSPAQVCDAAPEDGRWVGELAPVALDAGEAPVGERQESEARGAPERSEPRPMIVMGAGLDIFHTELHAHKVACGVTGSYVRLSLFKRTAPPSTEQ